MEPNPSLAGKALSWALQLTAIPSVTGTADEADAAAAIVAMLHASPSLASAEIWTFPVPGGRFRRDCVAALLRGEGRQTLVLTGHYDTVHVEDYGALRPLALDPPALRPALIAALDGAEDAASRSARADLASGAFLPGRGLLDMKSGLAAAVAVMEQAAAKPTRRGNLLLLIVPDEEANSAGARAAAPLLGPIAAARALEIVGAINLDCIGDPGDGTAGRRIALGSVGKLLPFALVVGRAAHVADSYAGLGACALAGAVAAAMEWAPELAESTEGDLAPGPTLLGMRDTKPGYDVTMPGAVWMFWNVICHRHGPEEVLGKVEAILRRALDATLATLAARRPETARGTLPSGLEIVRYGDLLAEVTTRHPEAAAAIATRAAALAESGLDLPEQCRQITELVWSLSGRGGPAAVLGFASLPYLACALGDDPASRRLDAAARDAAAAASTRHGLAIGTRPFFPGISDMSYLGQADESAVPEIARNTPCWGPAITWPDGPALGQVPIINVGPWGRDYHTRLERVDADYAFTIVPDMLEDIIERVLGPAGK
jgi:arginine utilization protein RocB